MGTKRWYREGGGPETTQWMLTAARNTQRFTSEAGTVEQEFKVVLHLPGTIAYGVETGATSVSAAKKVSCSFP